VDVFAHSLVTNRVTVTDPADKSGGDDAAPMADPREELLRLNPCSMTVSSQDEVDAKWDFAKLVAATLERSRGFISGYYGPDTMMNVYRSRYSIAMLEELIDGHERQHGFEYTHVVVARPDAAMLSPLSSPLPPPDTILVPQCCHGHHPDAGVNDRFAFGARGPMRHYMREFNVQLALGAVRMYDTEQLMCYHLAVAPEPIRLGTTSACVVRSRADGKLTSEEFVWFDDPKVRFDIKCHHPDVHLISNVTVLPDEACKTNFATCGRRPDNVDGVNNWPAPVENDDEIRVQLQSSARTEPYSSAGCVQHR